MRKPKKETKSQNLSVDQIIKLINARDSRHVSEDTAMNIAAVWQAVRLKSHGLASLPLHVYKRDDVTGLEKVEYAHPVNQLFKRPNRLITQYKFIETLQKNLELTGNAYAEIQRNNAGNAIALWPIQSSLVTPEVIETDNIQDIIYKVQSKNGTVAIPSENMLHVKGLSTDGIVGLSKIKHAMDSMSVCISATKYGANFFHNQARPSGLLKMPAVSKQDAYDKMKTDMVNAYTGLGNVGNMLIVPNGVDFSPFEIKPVEAQFLQTRKFSNEEIANWFGLRAYMLTGANSAFSNIWQQDVDFHTYSIRPECINWEQEIEAKLLADTGYHVKFNMDSILRADTVTRYTAYTQAINAGFMTVGEVRQLENLPPLPEPTK